MLSGIRHYGGDTFSITFSDSWTHVMLSYSPNDSGVGEGQIMTGDLVMTIFSLITLTKT